jgi:hypothetical protein
VSRGGPLWVGRHCKFDEPTAAKLLRDAPGRQLHNSSQRLLPPAAVAGSPSPTGGKQSGVPLEFEAKATNETKPQHGKAALNQCVASIRSIPDWGSRCSVSLENLNFRVAIC